MRGLATVDGNFGVSGNFSIFISGLVMVEGNFGVRGNVVVVLFFLARYSLFVRGLVTSKSCTTLAAESVLLTTRQLLLPGSLGSVFVSSHHGLVCTIVCLVVLQELVVLVFCCVVSDSGSFFF